MTQKSASIAPSTDGKKNCTPLLACASVSDVGSMASAWDALAMLELDVPAWTEAEAEAWWRTHREAVEERRKAERVGPRATLAVDLAYRS